MRTQRPTRDWRYRLITLGWSMGCAATPAGDEPSEAETATATGAASPGSTPADDTGPTEAGTADVDDEADGDPSEDEPTEPPQGSTTAAPDESSTDDTSTGASDLPGTASLGCTSGGGLSEGEHHFEIDGRDRRYRLRLPLGYAGDRAYPLLLALHPNGMPGNIGYWDADEGDRAIGPLVEDEAILVLAEDVDGRWNNDLAPELEYFDTIIEQAKAELCIDQARIFSMGFSGGGSFSGVLGCHRDDIRAIATGGSIMYFDPEDCVGTPAAWVTIGRDEMTNGRASFRDFWRDTAGCENTTSATTPDPCVAYDGCAEGLPVHYCEHGGGHRWPSFGAEAAWAFFSAL